MPGGMHERATDRSLVNNRVIATAHASVRERKRSPGMHGCVLRLH